MALYTILLEFDGGTYISQVRAPSARRAVAQYASRLPGGQTMSTMAVRKRLAKELLTDNPVAIQGVKSVWCCSATIGKKFALLNIVATASVDEC